MAVNLHKSFTVTHNSDTLLLKRYITTIMFVHLLYFVGLTDTEASAHANKYKKSILYCYIREYYKNGSFRKHVTHIKWPK